ncbi:NUDIX hydrolase [Pontibacter anaerobius]|uniref:NUDIX domain-containing protein n=1 Tax=Pontibacter anaerobius TaxID=2993940 RepID=A0ABT3RJ45_9BACT|nr:NUDIX domain-containing protein [Pontibacter anaerobius]MCX2741830.1 NUDIX domain-containing protein [Pontibacter anaerobius]
MNVFINDIPLILKKATDKVYKHEYDLILKASEHFTSKDLVGDVLIKEADPPLIDRLVRLMEVKKLKKLKSLTLVADKKKKIIEHLKDQFKIVRAAGGLVLKDGKILMIYRLGVWDLPKGKLEKKEKVREGAMREVEEECNIQVEVVEKLPKTWHSYAFKGKKILKKTSWYVMNCTDDSLMKPQAEEFIEEVRWMTPEEVQEVLPNAYTSIAFVIRHYLQSLKTGKV